MHELHLLLRIFDVLFDNLMALATMLNNAARDGSSMLEGLATAVRECGVNFHIWKDKEGGDKCKYTGNGMKKVLKVCVHQCTAIHAGVQYRCCHHSWKWSFLIAQQKLQGKIEVHELVPSHTALI